MTKTRLIVINRGTETFQKFSTRLACELGPIFGKNSIFRRIFAKFGKISEIANKLVLRGVTKVSIDGMCFYVSLKQVRSKKKIFSTEVPFLNPIFRDFGVNLQLFYGILHCFFIYVAVGRLRPFPNYLTVFNKDYLCMQVG